MKTYIDGYYCRDDLHLQIINKESNRRILEALRQAYPSGLDAIELAEKTHLPLKTIYSQRAELFREYYISEVDENNRVTATSIAGTKRGRPKLYESLAQRSRKKVVIEEASGVHDIYGGKKPVPVPPGNVVYIEDFIDIWHKIVTKEEKDELCTGLLQFLEKMYNRISEYDVNEIREWAPEKRPQMCCSHCGLNHEARDFMRAMLLHLIDQLESHEKFIDFMKNNQFLTQESYDVIKAKIEKNR